MNKKRIRMMARLAYFEQKNGKLLWNAEEYFRSDYIWIHLFKNLIRITLAYCTGAALWACYNIDGLMEKLNTMEVRDMGIRFLISYVVIAAVFLLITYLIYAVRFYRSELKLQTYRNMLEQLIMEYDTETGNREDQGGMDYETTVKL